MTVYRYEIYDDGCLVRESGEYFYEEREAIREANFEIENLIEDYECEGAEYDEDSIYFEIIEDYEYDDSDEIASWYDTVRM